MKRDLKNSRLIILFTIAAVIAWAGSPLLTFITAQTFSTSSGTVVITPLRGTALGGVMPSGIALYKTNSDGTHQLDVDISAINLPAGTVLEIFVGVTKVGQITVSANKDGKLELGGEPGQTVPALQSGDLITVRQDSRYALRSDSGSLLAAQFGQKGDRPAMANVDAP